VPFLRLRTLSACLVSVGLSMAPAVAAQKRAAETENLDLETVNKAEWRRGTASAAFLLRLQVLLDRAHASPGQIDSRRGENLHKAIAAFREMRGLGTGQQLDGPVWRALADNDSEPALVTYTITERDVSGPFIDKVPSDYREKAALKRLSYTSPEELLAEKFHMSERLLRQLNPNAAFGKAGTEIVVANIRRTKLPRRLARIEVDATRRRVLALDEDSRIVAVYPATVGSAERPSPSGEFKVTAVTENPPYRYDPALNLRGVNVQERLDLPPGPNNPVGLVWIALSAKGYGIHGTPDPESVGKRASHGCIRLTNWDALELAKHVSKGTPVNIAAASASHRRAK
jgi:lipoprotein-anchoring transpeptidase ErfK/SrfK